jgi:hypothetical protein
MNPPCETCRYFIPGRYARTGRCSRFIAYRGRGKIVYDFTEQARLDKTKCGPEGRFFISRDDSKKMSLERLELLTRLFDEDE